MDALQVELMLMAMQSNGDFLLTALIKRRHRAIKREFASTTKI